ERSLATSLSSPETVAADWFSAEIPRYRAESEAFCIDQLLVTQEQYADFVTRTRRAPPGISRADYTRQGFLVHAYSEWIPYLWTRGTPPQGWRDHPVVLVSAPDAEARCKWRHPAGRLPLRRAGERPMSRVGLWLVRGDSPAASCFGRSRWAPRTAPSPRTSGSRSSPTAGYPQAMVQFIG